MMHSIEIEQLKHRLQNAKSAEKQAAILRLALYDLTNQSKLENENDPDI